MKTIEESVVTALDGSDIELYPFLPYILQDLWEMGAVPESIIKIISKHFDNPDILKCLDLGCGKGAVSIKVAQQFGCKFHGIDALAEFIGEAHFRAKQFGVEHLCKFEIGDIRKKIKKLKGYDVIILGAIGPVFGDYYKTLTKLSVCLNNSGIIIIDDAFIDNHSNYEHPLVSKKKDIVKQIKLAGMKLLEVDVFDKNYIKKSEKFMLKKIENRCTQLIKKYPDKKQLFVNYITKQKEESEILQNKVICANLVFQKNK